MKSDIFNEFLSKKFKKGHYITDLRFLLLYSKPCLDSKSLRAVE